MFITQKEIEARLASDDNLLVSLFKDSSLTPISEDHENLENNSDNLNGELLNDPDERASVNINSILNCDGRDTPEQRDINLSRIVESIDQEQGTRDGNHRSGRPRDAINRSVEQRSDIALMGKVLGHGLAADLLGISTASSSLHARGLVNHDDEVDADLSKLVRRKLTTIRHKSANALIKVLDHADTAQMYDQIKTAKDAVFVANQLANVVQKVQHKDDDIKPTAQFVIIQPTVKTVEQYEVINV